MPADSDVPAWSRDGSGIYATTRVGSSIELVRVKLDGHAVPEWKALAIPRAGRLEFTVVQRGYWGGSGAGAAGVAATKQQ